MGKDNPEFSCMWVGSQLPRIAWLSLSSAVHHGYEPHIYLYDQNIDVPKGAIKHDANEIVLESDVFIRHKMYTNFSDLFRYALLAKKDCVWFDLDCIFVNDRFQREKDYVFAYEMYDPLLIGTGLIKYPHDSQIAEALLTRCRHLISDMRDNFEDGTWIVFGPGLFTDCVFEFGLEQHVMKQEFLYPIMHHLEDLQSLISPESFTTALSRVESEYRLGEGNASVIHIWASAFAMHTEHIKLNKFEEFPEGSLLSYYDQKFRINEIA